MNASACVDPSASLSALLACKTFIETRTLISGDQKLWEGGHDGGLPDSCVFNPVRTDCSV